MFAMMKVKCGKNMLNLEIIHAVILTYLINNLWLELLVYVVYYLFASVPYYEYAVHLYNIQYSSSTVYASPYS